MNGVNQVVLVGNLTRDPTVRDMPSGGHAVTLPLAVNREWRSRDGGGKETCFVDCTAFGPVADLCAEVARKGDAVMVTGRLRYETWEDRESRIHHKHTVVIDQVRFFRQGDSPPSRAPSPRLEEGGEGKGPSQDDLPF